MILTIGCSFTFGDELSDRTKQAWPYLLADKLSTTVNNQGKGYASNDYMFRVAVEETSQQTYDTVIVQWSEPSRIEVWNNILRIPSTISAHGGTTYLNNFPWKNDFYKYNYDDLFRHRTWFCHVLSLQEYFKSINQPYVFFNILGLRVPQYEKFYPELQHLWNKLDTKNYPGWPHSGFSEWQGNCPIGPGGHPLELGHQRVADKLYEHIICNRR